MSRWFRHYAGMCSDPKFGGIARRSKVSRDRVVFVFAFILETAAEQNDGGVFLFDADAVAELLHCETEEVEGVFREIVSAGLIEGEKVKKWASRQYEDRTNAERQARFKAKRKVETSGNAQVTESNCVTNAPHRQSTETDTEKNITSVEVIAPKARKPRKKAVLSVIDPNRQPETRDRDAAYDVGMTDSDFRSEWKRWRDHHISKASEMADWFAAWRTWCGNFKKFSRNQRGGMSALAKMANGDFLGGHDERFDSPDEGQSASGPEPGSSGFAGRVSERDRGNGGPFLDLRPAGSERE